MLKNSNITICQICDNNIVDTFKSKGVHSLVECNNCGFVWFNPLPMKEETKEFYNDVYSHGTKSYFGKVEKKVLPGSSEDLKILEIFVEEKATGEIMAGAGIGTDGTSFQFAVSENNWLGRGVILQSALNVSQEKIINSTSSNFNKLFKFFK